MGKYRYERLDTVEGAKNIINFDSSPKYSICKQFGFAMPTFELRQTSANSKEIMYDVFAGQLEGGTQENPTYSKPTKRGTLREFTQEQLLSRFG